MDHNIAAWMIAGGPQIELASERRDREQLHAYLEGQRSAEPGPSLVERIRDLVRPAARVEPACCPA
jgi:hypothetical protein